MEPGFMIFLKKTFKGTRKNGQKLDKIRMTIVDEQIKIHNFFLKIFYAFLINKTTVGIFKNINN